MKLKDAIKWRKTLEEECAELAAKYAATKDWYEASVYYRAADVHHSVRTHLEGHKNDKA